MILLDGPLGTELARRGVDTSGRAWSARALTACPERIAAIHRDYARAGATVHTTATFRTQRRVLGDDWRPLVGVAVRLARGAVPRSHRIAGSIAPLEDCYHPERSPEAPFAEHLELARALAEEGVDLLLVETFAHVGEAVAATRAARSTGLEVWCALSAGYRGDLLELDDFERGAEAVRDAGAERVLVNCTPLAQTHAAVERLARSGRPIGVYANAGSDADGIGWDVSADGPRRYAEAALRWADAGATVIGGCCGTGPAHVRALREAFEGPSAS